MKIQQLALMIALVLILSALVLPVAAQGGTVLPNPTNFDMVQFLVWICVGGGATAVFAFVAERIPWFQRQPSTTKSYIALGATLVISLLAKAVLTYVPPDFWVQNQEWFIVIAGVISAWITGQAAHRMDNKFLQARRGGSG